MYRILVPTFEEIVEINKGTENGRLLKETSLIHVVSRLEALRLSGDRKKDIIKAVAILWIEIIEGHPFLDGNKRTATESVKIFLSLNDFKLKTPENGLIYISLKIANNEMGFEKLTKWLEDNIESL